MRVLPLDEWIERTVEDRDRGLDALDELDRWRRTVDVGSDAHSHAAPRERAAQRRLRADGRDESPHVARKRPARRAAHDHDPVEVVCRRRVAQHPDRAHRRADQHDPWCVRPGSFDGGGNVVTFLIAERGFAAGCSVTAAVVGEHVKPGCRQALAGGDDCGVATGRTESVHDDDGRARFAR